MNFCRLEIWAEIKVKAKRFFFSQFQGNWTNFERLFTDPVICSARLLKCSNLFCIRSQDILYNCKLRMFQLNTIRAKYPRKNFLDWGRTFIKNGPDYNAPKNSQLVFKSPIFKLFLYHITPLSILMSSGQFFGLLLQTRRPDPTFSIHCFFNLISQL